MPEASTSTAPAAAAEDGAVNTVAIGEGAAPADTGAAQGSQAAEGDGILDRLRDRCAPLSPRARRAKAVPMLRHLRWRHAQAAGPLLQSLRDAVEGALVALKADRHAAAGRYVGRAYLDRRFLFSLDFGPGARSDQHGDPRLRGARQHGDPRLRGARLHGDPRLRGARLHGDPPAFEELAADAEALLLAATATADAGAPPPLPKENDEGLLASVDAIEADEAAAPGSQSGAGDAP